MNRQKRADRKLNRLYLHNYLAIIIFAIAAYLFYILIINGILGLFVKNTNYEAADYIETDYRQIQIPSLIEIGGGFTVVDGSTYEILSTKGKDFGFNQNCSKENIFRAFTVDPNKSEYYKVRYSTAYCEEGNYWLVLQMPSSQLLLTVSWVPMRPEYEVMITVLVLASYVALAGMIFKRYSGKNADRMKRELKPLCDIAMQVEQMQYDTPEKRSDIAEIAYVEEVLCTMAARVKDEMEKRMAGEEKLRHFMLDVSHDLKNPLTNVLGYSKKLKNQSEEEARIRCCNIIMENARRANELIMRLYELAQTEVADYRPKLWKLDLAELVRQVVIGRLDELEELKMEPVLSIPEEEIWVEGNSGELTRAISNIIDNTIKYHKEGTSISVCMNQTETAVNISFVNYCEEIDPFAVEGLMEPYVRMAGAEKLNPLGIGLGLAIVRNIITYHKGSVECKTGENNSFVITVQIPVLQI